MSPVSVDERIRLQRTDSVGGERACYLPLSHILSSDVFVGGSRWRGSARLGVTEAGTRRATLIGFLITKIHISRRISYLQSMSHLKDVIHANSLISTIPVVVCVLAAADSRIPPQAQLWHGPLS